MANDNNNIQITDESQIVLYQPNESISLQVKIDASHDTVWLTQQQIADLFGTKRPAITKHLRNIFNSGELDQNSVSSILEHTAADGKTYKTQFYNLDAIISVGYRIKSHVATRFRIWATQHIKEYIVKGFVIDDERLKNPDLPFDYFEELLRRIQDIRTSEKRFYQKITDIYATSVDYDPTLETSILFFKTVQNKMHWAITGQTAAELIKNRADSEKPNMGLTSWRGEKPRKQDVSVAKNYLNEEELLALNNLVEQYLVFAEGQAMRKIPMYMNDWIEKLHGFLSLNDREILKDAGRVTHELAIGFAENEYEKYRVKTIAQKDKQLDDFEQTVKQLEQQTKTKKKQ